MPTLSEPGSPVIKVRAGKHPTFDRLVFDWDSAVDYGISRDGDRVVIRFSKPGQADLASVRFMELTFGDTVRNVGGANGLAVQMDVPAGSEVRDFRLDGKVVLDIIRSDAEKLPPDTATRVTSAETPAQRTSPPPRQAAATPAPAASTQPPVPTIRLANPPPVPGERPEPPVIPETTDPRENVAAGTEAEDAQAAAEDHSAATLDLAQPAEQAAPAPGATGSVDLIVVAPPSDDPQATDENGLDPSVTAIRIDPNVPTAAVAFVRSDALWIAFGLPNLDVAPLVEGPAAGQLRRADIYALDGGTAYRFPLPPGLYPRMGRDGRVWEVELAPVVTPAPSARIDIEGTDISAGKRLNVSINVAATVLELVDPTIGDRLLLIPALESGQAVREGRRLPQLEILPAVQGMVIRPLVSDLEVDAGTETVKLYAPGGLLLNADRRALLAAASSTPETANSARLFDLEVWQRGPLATFEKNRTTLEAQIAALEDADKSVSILDLARLNFSHGFGAEAEGLVQLATEFDPELADKPEVVALRGAAEALRGAGPDALADLSIDALSIHPEAALWRGVALARQGRWVEAGKEFSRSGDIVLSYPNGLYLEISTLMSEALLVVDEVNAAEALVNELERRGQKARVNLDAINYLRGDINMRRGLVDEGQALWRQVADAGSDQLYRVKAKYGLIEAGLARGDMPKKDAVEELEKLRFAWRGDTLELAMLRRLGTLYLDTEQYFAGFDLLRRAAGYFPGSQQSEVLTSDMAQAFRQLFVDGEADKLSPIQAYALFDEFRELNPIGVTGDKVIQRLAERLISVDLLGEAGEILQQQVEFRVTGPEKARLGARLAGVRLLDDMPELALEALDLSEVPENLDPALVQERMLLRARAYQEQGEPEQALAVIAGLNTLQADRLRADIGWRSGNWKVAGRALFGLLDAPPPEGQVPTQEQSQLIMNTAVALSLASDQPGLNRLRDTYNDAMALTPLADSFRLVTRPLTGTLLADMDTLQQQMQEVDLFGEFLNSYRNIQDGSISGADGTMNSITQTPESAPAAAVEAQPADNQTAELPKQ